MGSTQLNDIHDILSGNGKGQGKGAAGAHGHPGQKATASGHPSGLNQLSDAAEKIAVKTEPAAIPLIVSSPVLPQLPSQGQSQEQLIDAAQQMQFQQPSQPDIPPPVLPESQAGSQPMATLGDDAKALLQNAALTMGDPNAMLSLLTSGPITLNMETLGLAGYPYNLSGLGSPEDDGTAGMGRSKGKKQTRRGPMDEMRQLIRILVKIFPHSVGLIGATDEAGGGNRISEEQIKNYLEKTLGEAPRPTWGVPTGWNGYLAELFSWATGKVVTGEEAKRVAKREPGRSWEAIESELAAIGVYPNCWPVPLTLAGVQEAQQKLVPQPVPSLPTVKRAAEEAGLGVPSKRSRSMAERDLNKMDEADIWKLINDALNVALNKANTGADQNAVMNQKLAARTKFDEITGFSVYNYGLPLVNPDILSAMQAALPGGTLPPFDPADPASVQAALNAAAAAAALEDRTLRLRGEGEVDAGADEDALKVGAVAEGVPGSNADTKNAAAAPMGSLPLQPPPLSVANFNLAYMQIPNLNLGGMTHTGGLASLPQIEGGGAPHSEVHHHME